MKDHVWGDLPDRAKHTMHWLGCFGPTVHADRAEAKGYHYDDGEGCKTYLSAAELRDMAADLIAAADWLEARADTAEKPEGR